MVRWPYGAVETAPIDERDIAAVTVRALSEASLAGADFVLTGPEALSHARQVAVIGEVLGRRLAFHELTPDDFRRETAATWPTSPARPPALFAIGSPLTPTASEGGRVGGMPDVL